MLRWFINLMRRFFFPVTRTAVTPVIVVVPPPGSAALQFNLLTNSQYVPLISF